MTTIDDSNHEVWLLRYAENELTAEERTLVEQWLDAHPEMHSELQQYIESPHLEPNAEVRYAGDIPGSKRRLWPAVLRWTAAAAVVAALVLPLARHRDVAPQSQSAPMLAQTQPTLETPSVASPTAEPVPSIPRPVAPVDETVTSQPVMTEPYNGILPYHEAKPLEDMAEESAPDTAPRLIYVDNLFEQDTLLPMEQQLVDLTDEIRRSLDKSYLGRRMARQLPSDEELVASARSVRNRTPRTLRYIGDMVGTLASMND